MAVSVDLSQWLALLPRSWVDGYDPSVIDIAKAAYQTPPRHYHNWNHVVDCVETLRAFPGEHPRALFLALVFHDAIYVAGREDNEEQSAMLAKRTLASSGLPTFELASIERMIRATKNHAADVERLSPDESVMLDVDLAILAAPRDDYARYAKAIRDEYVPTATTEPRFRIGRLAFLRRTLAARHVFVTTEGRQRWDALARENIAWEIAALEKEQSRVERLFRLS